MTKQDILLKYAQVAKLPTDMVEHMPTLKTYACEASTIVEFGVDDCTSTWALLAGLPEQLTSYDPIRKPEVDEVVRVTAQSGVRFHFVQGSSLNAVFKTSDLLFIDSLHTYEQLRAELQLHAANVAKYIILHDTTLFADKDETYSGRGLWPAIEEFLAGHPEWRIKERYTNCHGLTVLQRAALPA